MSFMLYEGELCSGLLLEEKALLTTLRITGKALAPKKLQVFKLIKFQIGLTISP
jgi:hypothetical protein